MCGYIRQLVSCFDSAQTLKCSVLQTGVVWEHSTEENQHEENTLAESGCFVVEYSGFPVGQVQFALIPAARVDILVAVF